MRIGIIGAGTISQSVHIPSIRRAGFELAVVCDLSLTRANEVAAFSGARATSDPDEVFAASDVDAVLIATPGSHAVLAAAALRAGKHILAEKPVALTVREVDELMELASAHNRVAQVGYMKMYDPLTARARSELNALDDIRLVRITVAHPDDGPQVSHLRMTQPYADADREEIAKSVAYEDDRAAEALPGANAALLGYYAGVLNGSIIHEFSLLRAMGLALPDAWSVSVFPEFSTTAPASLLAVAAVGPVRYLLSWNWLPDYPEYNEELKVLAGNGRLEYHLAKPYLLEARSYLRVERSVGLERQDTRYFDTYETGFLRQLDAFRSAIVDGTPVVSTLEGAKVDIAQVQSLAKAIARSQGAEIVTEAEAEAAAAARR